MKTTQRVFVAALAACFAGSACHDARNGRYGCGEGRRPTRARTRARTRRGKGAAGRCDDAGRGERRGAAHRLHRHRRNDHGGSDRRAGCATGAGWKAAGGQPTGAGCAQGSQGRGADGADVLRGVLQEGREGRGPADYVLLQRRAGQLDGVAAHGLAGAEARGDGYGHASAGGALQDWWTMPTPCST